MNLTSTNNKAIRKFGIVAFILFGCLAALGIWRDKPIPIYLFGFLSGLAIGFVLIPARLKPVYTTWLRIADFVGKVMTTVILTLAYYLVITPAGLIKRLFGGPLLPVKPDKGISSYWVVRIEPVQPKQRFSKRY